MPFAISRTTVARVEQGAFWLAKEPARDAIPERATLDALVELVPQAEWVTPSYEVSEHLMALARVEAKAKRVTQVVGEEHTDLLTARLRDDARMKDPAARSWAEVLVTVSAVGAVAAVTHRTFARRIDSFLPLLTDHPAIELLALFQRLTSPEVVVPHGTHEVTTTMSRADFGWQATKTHAPQWAALMFAFARGPSDLRDLARSCVERVERALRAKDLLGGAVFFEEGRSALLDCALHFDSWTWTLRAAYDSFATLLHRLYGLPDDVLPAWRSAGWRDELVRLAPQFADITSNPSVWPALQTLTELRNPIHTETSLTDPYASRNDPLLLISERVADGIRRYSGLSLASHGVQYLAEGGAAIRPYPLAREMTIRTLAALDELAGLITVPADWVDDALWREPDPLDEGLDDDVRLLGGLQARGLVD